MTGKLKTFEEIHEAHDKMHLALDHITFETEAQRAHFIGCANVLCWILGHEHSDSGGESFQNSMLSLEFSLIEMGIFFKEKSDAEPSQGAD